MLKKMIFASALLAATTGIALADAAPYVGAGLGVNINTEKTSHLVFRGVPFNVVAGYGGLINPNFYLGGELSATLATGEMSHDQFHLLRTTYAYSASIIPGLMVSDHTMAFARAGIGKTHFASTSFTPAKTQTTGIFGLGLQTSLTQNVDLRGEYDYQVMHSFNGIKPRADQVALTVIYKIA